METAQDPSCGLRSQQVEWTEKFLSFVHPRPIRAILIEPNTKLCEILRRRFPYQQVKIINAAAGAQPGTGTFYRSNNDLCSTTRIESAWARRVDNGLHFCEENVRIVTLDEMHEFDLGNDRNMLSERRILKVDCEGAEYDVLSGAERCIRSQFFDVIQFEWTVATLESGFTLRRFFELFEERGYRVGRLFPCGVGFFNYRARLNRLLDGNWVAVRESDSELMAAVGLSGFDSARMP